MVQESHKHGHHHHSHHKVEFQNAEDDDSQHQYHDRHRLASIAQITGIKQQLQKLRDMKTEDVKEFNTSAKAKAYDHMMLDLLDKRAIPEVHDTVVDEGQVERGRLLAQLPEVHDTAVDEGEVEREQLAQEKEAERKQLEKDLLPLAASREELIKEKNQQRNGLGNDKKAKAHRSSPLDFDDFLCCCIDHRGGNSQFSPRRPMRPPQSVQLGEHETVRPSVRSVGSSGGPRYNSKNDAMHTPRPSPRIGSSRS